MQFLKQNVFNKKIVKTQTFDWFQRFFSLSGYQDSNLGPPAPKAGALTGLRYTPNNHISSD